MLTEGITEVKLCIVSYYYFHPSPRRATVHLLLQNIDTIQILCVKSQEIHNATYKVQGSCVT